MPVTDHELSCDILVAGGGPAGVPCALAAARSGAKVILCQDRPVLGGNASSEVRMHIVGANGTGRFDRGEELVTEAREGGIIEEIRLENAVQNPQRSASVFDLILYDKCRVEPNLELMLNTAVVGCEMEGSTIVAALAERQSTEDRFRITASAFVDCTGDGRLGVEAGAAFMEGREGRESFGETLAEEKGDNQRLGSTILLQARKHPMAMPFLAPSWARPFSKEDLKLRLYANPGEEEPTHEYGYWWAEWGGTRDTIKDNEEIRDELLAISLGIWDHIKNGPGEERFQADNWALDWIGFLPGKRESRRFVGQHILTEHDLLSSRSFPDAIAYGGWSLDLHPPEGVDAPDIEPCVQHPVPELYDIPLRACVARDVENLMFAGRNLSATHIAFSSTRVMATCATVGQGVGTAAAVAVAKGKTISEVAEDPECIDAIQRHLLDDDSFLIGLDQIAETDPVRSARITASSELPDGAAANVASVQTRSVHGPSGSSRSPAGSHRWISDPQAGFPAWIQFEWPEPISLNRIQLIFDTGLHRHLTLSHHDGYTSKMQWGRPQEETVRDYEIKIRVGGEWRCAKEVSGNYQRLNRHELGLSPGTEAVRITVRKTNGLDHVRIAAVQIG
ncbi:MAG: FAD-dependent oxidoreductase [Verrucomicrobiales bacterium]|nr:FAD-dependent oxidoreductase [Verrucomicrobiales bacterium]